MTTVARRNDNPHNANKQIVSKLNKPQFTWEIQY